MIFFINSLKLSLKLTLLLKNILLQDLKFK